MQWVRSLRSPDNRDLPFDPPNNCVKLDLNLKILFELSCTQAHFYGGGTTWNPPTFVWGYNKMAVQTCYFYYPLLHIC